MRNVTIRQLQIFSEAAQRLSFARVAEQMNLSPAAVSFQIQQIESIIGFALFERIGKKAALTDAGESLLIYAKIILKALHDADESMKALKGVTGGHVTIGLVSTAKYIVPHMLTRFQAIYPGIAIDLIDGNRRQIIDALVNGQVDLAIMGQPPDGVDVSAKKFAVHPSVIIAAPSHPLAGGTALRTSVLAGERFVVREEGSGTRSLLDRYCHAAGISPRIVMTSSSNETIKQAVMAGMGVAVISRHTVGLELGLGLISSLAIEGFPLRRSWFVVHRRKMALLPVHLRLRAFFIEQGQAIIDDLSRSHNEIGARVRGKTGSVRRRLPTPREPLRLTEKTEKA
jgi:DNA-binding transcriptional LysR family regulator